MNWFYLAFISAILSALASIIEKKVLFELRALDFSFILAIVNALLVILFIGNVDYESLNLVGLIILYFKTFLGALAFWFVMLALKNMQISGALPLMVLTPGLLALFSYVILGETIESIEIIGMFLLLIGTYLLEIKKNDGIFQPFKTFWKSDYHHYIIYAILLFTFSSIIDKVVLKYYKMPPISFLVFQQFFLAINFTIIILFKGKNIVSIVRLINKRNVVWIVLISIITLGYRYTQIEAFKIAPIALVLTIKRTSIFFASIFGGRIFSDENLLKKGIAIIVLLFGAYLITAA